MSSRLGSLIRLAVALPVASWLPAAAVLTALGAPPPHGHPSAAAASGTPARAAALEDSLSAPQRGDRVAGPALSRGPQAPAQSPRSPVVRDLAGELACGASTAAAAPAAAIRIAPGPEHGKALFGPGDPIIVLAGTAQGVRVGQEYFVRRVIADRFAQTRSDGMPTFSIHTAGWVKIVETSTDAAIATVTRACDAMQEGDYLEPFVLPSLPSPAAAGEPDYAHPGHVILGDDRRQMGAQGDLMVLDRGSDHGLHVGQGLTIFRTTAGGTGPVARIGEAVALIVSPETALIRIEKTTDPIYVGDLVAIHR